MPSLQTIIPPLGRHRQHCAWRRGDEAIARAARQHARRIGRGPGAGRDRAPGVDATAQAPDFLEAVPLKICGCIHAARALMIVNYEQIGAGPVGQDFLHEFLSEEMRARELYGIEFLAGSNVEKVNRFPGRETLRKFTRLDLHRAIGCVAREDVLRDFIDIEIFVACANASERFVRAETAAAAAADMVAAEQRALRPGKLLQELAHANAGIDCRGGIHCAK